MKASHRLVHPAMRAAVSFALMAWIVTGAPARAAQNLFVSDQLSAELRQQPGDSKPVTGQIAAGTPVETVTTAPGGWTQVRTRAGQIGWLRSSQLMNLFVSFRTRGILAVSAMRFPTTIGARVSL